MVDVFMEKICAAMQKGREKDHFTVNIYHGKRLIALLYALNIRFAKVIVYRTLCRHIQFKCCCAIITDQVCMHMLPSLMLLLLLLMVLFVVHFLSQSRFVARFK